MRSIFLNRRKRGRQERRKKGGREGERKIGKKEGRLYIEKIICNG